MLPQTDIEDAETKTASYKTFLIDFENKSIGGMIDGKEALVQWVKIALMTPRYKYPVFSHSYGTDYTDVFEGGYSKAIGKLKKAIYDSLIHDERIKAIDDFVFEKRGTKTIVRFKISSVYGPVSYETEVE